jgi:hypothetical protein
MDTQQIINSLLLAERQLVFAQNELKRPNEDVVTLSACQLVRSSMKHIMRLYLLAQGEDWSAQKTLDGLMNLCISKNKAFSAVDIADIECKEMDHEKCDSRYCLTIDNVGKCVNAASQLKNIVWKEMKIHD